MQYDYQCVGACEEKYTRDYIDGCPLCRGRLVPTRIAEQIILEKRMAAANTPPGTDAHYECTIQMRVLALSFLGMLVLNIYLGWTVMHQ